MNKSFFSTGKNFIEPKLYMNDHWVVNYKVYNFYMDQQSKMATSTEQKLSLGKVISKPISLTQLNC
jgi:hypothetical protein